MEAIFLSLWLAPHAKGRLLFVAAPPACVVNLGNSRPIAAIVEGNAYKILDCQTQKVLNVGQIKHRLSLPQISGIWDWPGVLPNGYYEGENPWHPYGCTSRFTAFSADDRFLVIRSSITESPISAITLVETTTGKELTWIGEQTTQYFEEIKFKPDSATIYSHGKEAAQLKATPPFESPLTAKMNLDVSGLAVWCTDWNDYERRVSLYRVDRSDELDVKAALLGPTKSKLLIWQDPDAIQLQDARSGEPMELPKTFDNVNTRIGVEDVIEDSSFAIIHCESAQPDRLETEYQQFCWNVIDGSALEFPYWHSDARQVGQKMLVQSYEKELFWFDLNSGARENIFSPWRYNFGREAVMLAWGGVWWFLVKPARPQDRSRTFGYLLAICTIIAIAPPYFPIFSPHGLAQGYHWLLSIAALIPILMAALAAAIRRTVSIPLLAFAFLSLGFLLLAWGHRGGLDSSENGRLALRAWHNLPLQESDEEPDFFRPWRFGAPKPDNLVHIEFRDKLQTTEEKR